MSRAFVINVDEWGYCLKMNRKCSGADVDGKCMRGECSEIPEWEKPKRSLAQIQMEKMRLEQERLAREQNKEKK